MCFLTFEARSLKTPFALNPSACHALHATHMKQCWCSRVERLFHADMFRWVYIYLDTVQVWVCFKMKALHSVELWQCCFFLFTVKLLLPFLPSPFIKLSLYPGRKICVCVCQCLCECVSKSEESWHSVSRNSSVVRTATKQVVTYLMLQYKTVLQRYCSIILYYGRKSLLCFFCSFTSLFCIQTQKGLFNHACLNN